jgi:hypothetical protein
MKQSQINGQSTVTYFYSKLSQIIHAKQFGGQATIEVLRCYFREHGAYNLYESLKEYTQFLARHCAMKYRHQQWLLRLAANDLEFQMTLDDYVQFYNMLAKDVKKKAAKA